MAEGVLLMAHGVARDLEDIARYYAHIRGGRPLDPRVQAELEERYRRIGGHSPLLEITSALAAKVEEQLAARHGAGRYRVYVGYRHSPPYIADAVQTMAGDGVDQATGIVLAPHYSDMSVGAYVRAGEDAVRGLSRPLALRYILSWHLEPSLIQLLADRVREGLERLAEPEAMVLFTAHSLPESILARGDPYPEQVRETGEAVAAALGLRRYGFAWQSAGRTREPWLGPDVLERIRELAKAGERAVLVCPVGFVADHLEVLYDLDIEARDVAAEAGIKWGRTRSLNDDVRFAGVIADVLEHGDARTAAETRVASDA
jgi:ferrochelatase